MASTTSFISLELWKARIHISSRVHRMYCSYFNQLMIHNWERGEIEFGLRWAWFEISNTDYCEMFASCKSQWSWTGSMIYSGGNGKALQRKEERISKFTITGYKFISEFLWSLPPSASSKLHNYSPQVHLWVHSISDCYWISSCTRSWQPSETPQLLKHSLQVHFWFQLFLASTCITEFKITSPNSTSMFML